MYRILAGHLLLACAAALLSGQSSPAGLRDEHDASLAHATHSGVLEVAGYDDFENRRAESRYYLRGDDGAYYRIQFAELPRLLPGTHLHLDGIEAEGLLFVHDFEVLSAPPRGGANPNLGEQRTVVLLVNSQDNPIQPITGQQVWNKFFNDTNPSSVTSWVEEVSYGKAFMTGDVLGWYTLPIAESNLCTDSGVAASIAAADADVFFPDYARLFIIYPDAGCWWSGWGTIGMSSFSTDDGTVSMSCSRINGTQWIAGVGIHEFGHNLGGEHANDWECGGSIIGPRCTSIDYGDNFDVLGTQGHFNAFHMELIGWFDPGNVQETAADGVYTIEPIEMPGAGVKALKIPIADGEHYYVEYRRPLGYDVEVHNFALYYLGVDVYAGAMLHLDRFIPGLADTQLLDTLPNSQPDPLPVPGTDAQMWDSLYVVLTEGQTFEDVPNNISITTIVVAEDHLEVRLGPLPSGSCCRTDGSCGIAPENACTTGVWTESGLCEPNPCQLLAPGPPNDLEHRTRKHRYLSIDPSTNPSRDTAIKVEIAEMRRCVVDPRRACLVDEDCDPVCADDLDKYCTSPEQCGGADCIDTGPCTDMAPDYDPPLAWLVQEPQQQADGEWTAALSDTVYSEDWSASSVLHVSDCGIVPCVTYHVHACDPLNLDICSEPLEVATQRFPTWTPFKLYGDVAGGTVTPGPEVLPPDGYVNVKDLMVTLLTIQNYGGPNLPQAHPTWVDLHGLGTGIPPNYILSVADLQAVYVFSLTNGLPWVNSQGGVDPQDCP
ncbi:MAG: metallopeptidase domain-containing protein [Planctomycetota bacterium]